MSDESGNELSDVPVAMLGEGRKADRWQDTSLVEGREG